MKTIFPLSFIFMFSCIACQKQGTQDVQPPTGTNPNSVQKIDSSNQVIKYYGTTTFNTDDWSASQLNCSYADSILISYPTNDSIQFKYFANNGGTDHYPVYVRYKINNTNTYGNDSTFPLLIFSIANTTIAMNWKYGIYCGVYATQTFSGTKQ